MEKLSVDSLKRTMSVVNRTKDGPKYSTRIMGLYFFDPRIDQGFTILPILVTVYLMKNMIEVE